MPYPENLDHHFVVDPTKFDFYAMDCYRMNADEKMAENLASEVIQASTDFDGKNAHLCASLKLGSPLVSWQRAKETSKAHSPRDNAH
jgi:hypothetical protein